MLEIIKAKNNPKKREIGVVINAKNVVFLIALLKPLLLVKTRKFSTSYFAVKKSYSERTTKAFLKVLKIGIIENKSKRIKIGSSMDNPTQFSSQYLVK